MKTNSNSGLQLHPFSGLVSLKRRVQDRLVREFRGVLPSALIQRAIDEAEQVAASTGFPQLFLPALAEETVRRTFVAVEEQCPAHDKCVWQCAA